MFIDVRKNLKTKFDWWFYNNSSLDYMSQEFVTSFNNKNRVKFWLEPARFPGLNPNITLWVMMGRHVCWFSQTDNNLNELCRLHPQNWLIHYQKTLIRCPFILMNVMLTIYRRNILLNLFQLLAPVEIK